MVEKNGAVWGAILLLVLMGGGAAVWVDRTSTAQMQRSPAPNNAATRSMPATASSPVTTPRPSRRSATPTAQPKAITKRHNSPAKGIRGSPCTFDCSGHRAGYDWAERHGVSDPDECDGNSQSFIEGCEEYAEEIQDLVGRAPSDDEEVE